MWQHVGVRLWQRKLTKMQVGNGKDRLYFLINIFCRKSDETRGYGNLFVQRTKTPNKQCTTKEQKTLPQEEKEI